MSSIPNAIWHSVVGVAWRLAVGLGVILCFLGLSSLKDWHSQYAPSPAWADKVAERKDLDWAPVVKAAVKTMPAPEKPYTDKEIFYKALLKHLRNPDATISEDEEIKKKIASYHADLTKKEKYLPIFRTRTAQLESDFDSQFASRSKDLETLAGQIAKAREDRDKKKLDELIQQRTDIREDIRGLSAERSLIQAGLQAPLSDLEARIKSAEDGIREAFNAAPSSARPVDGAIAQAIDPKLAIEIGDETHPLHIFYFILWYGLEAFIVFLAGLVLVPWFLSLGGVLGRNPDPKAVQASTTSWFKDLLSKVFGPRGVSNAATVIAAMAVTGATLAGVSLAAGEQPSVPPFLQHESGGTVGAKGERGEPGQPGAPATPGHDGTDGKDAVFPPELQKTLDDQNRQIQEQAALISGLKGSIDKLSLALGNAVRPATKNDLAILATKEDLTQGVGPLNSGISNVNQRVDTLTSTDQSMKSSLEEADRSLDRIHDTTSKAASDVQQVRTDVAKAEDVPTIAADLLRINAMPDGVLTRLNPFARYEVTDEVIGTVKRATRYHDDDSEVQTILNGLEQVKGKKMGAGQLRLALLYYTPVKSDPGAYDLLDKKLMPLILKVSRL